MRGFAAEDATSHHTTMGVLDNAPGGCSPCMFAFGLVGGYLATTILNALGSSQDKDVPQKNYSTASSTKVEIDDEGNVIQHVPSTKERAAPQAASSASSDHGAVKLVIQRFRSASLLLSPDETAHINQSGDKSQTCGMLVYVSFSKAAETNRTAIFAAARTILNLPVLTRGVWGDGSGTVSVLDLATELDRDAAASSKGGCGVPIVLVPQANLVSRVKNNGKSIQYHGQVAKSLGKELFDAFVRSVQLISYEQQCLSRGEEVSASLRMALADVGGSTSDGNSSKGVGAPTFDPSVCPQDMFRDAAIYESWDGDGIPTAKVGGEKLTKSATKKMKKQHQAQKKRYEKYLAADGADKVAPTVKSKDSLDEEDVVKKLDAGFVNLVNGTFGILQNLSFESDMGPFCHLLNIG